MRTAGRLQMPVGARAEK